MKHKHYDCIVAWAEGKKIQLKWIGSNEWKDAPHPGWSTEYEYRIKPNTIKFRNYLYKFYDTSYIATVKEGEKSPLAMKSFVKWIGDWQEVEVDS